MNNFAISSTGIGEALMRSASALAGAGNTLEESIGLVTAANAVVQNPQQVGTAMKTLTMYLRAAKTEAEAAGESTDGMASSVSELRNQLLSLTGVDIMLDENNFKSTFQILKELSGVWEDLSDVSRANVTELIGGKRNANVIQAIMKNFQDAENAAKTASESAGSALRENEKYLESISGKIDVMKAAWESFSMSVMGSGIIKFFVSLGTALLNVGTALSKAHLLLPVLTTIVAMIGRMRSMDTVSTLSRQLYTAVAAGQDAKTAVANMAAQIGALTAAQKNYLYSQIAALPVTEAFTAEMKAQLLAALGLEDSMATLAATNSAVGASFAATSSAIPIWGQIAIAISLVVTALQFLVPLFSQVDEKAIETANDISEAFASANDTYDSNKQSLDNLESRFNELSKGVDKNGKNVSLTADEYDEYLSIVGQIVDISPSVVQGYDNEGNAILNYTTLLQDAKKAQEDLLNGEIDSFIANAPEIYSLSTIKKQMRIVSAPMRYAYEQRIIPFNPCASVKTPAKSNVHKVAREILAYTEDEQAKIRRVLDTRERVGYYVIELLLETGMRAGEALALNWPDVMIDKRRIRVHATVINLANRRRAYVQEGAKSPTSNRWVPLSTRAIAILKELKASSKHDWLFDSHGKRLSYEALRYQCQCACADAGVPYYGLHAWRHTFATNQYYKGTDVKILSKLLGHADTTITYNIYIHLYGDGFDDMLRALS